MAETRCIQCGHPVGDPPRLNALPDGTPCRQCGDRLLDALPAALPADPRPQPGPQVVQHELWEDAEIEEAQGAPLVDPDPDTGWAG